MDKYKDKSNSYDMNKIFKPLFIFILTSFLLACGKQTNNEATSGSNEPAKKSRGLIGATCMNIANPFFKVIEENMRDEAAKHGYDLIYLGCEMDISKQQKQIQDFLAKGVVAVAVNPKDSKAIGTAVKECNDKNIAIIKFNIHHIVIYRRIRVFPISHQVLQNWLEMLSYTGIVDDVG